MTISRRVFVKSGGLALVSLGLDPLFLARAAFASGRPTVRRSERPTLVCLFQRGAVDGLNMIVPHGEPAYYQERPRIAVPADSVVDLDGHFGLHPSLAPLKELWDNKSLAAIHAVGSPDSTRSHFDAQDYMRSEEHTSELQSRLHLVCRLLLEKKKNDKRAADIVDRGT